jgi:SAM-dependent methyltransferase/uncharacterized protein YbaR (Trm112 family)
MTWVCVEDRTPLQPGSDGASLRCPQCERVHPVVDGVPVFVTNEGEREAVGRSSASLDELWRAMGDRPAAEAAEEICRIRGYARSQYSADWKFFFSLPPGGTTLEVGAGFGDDSLDLAGKSGAAISIVPNLTNARIVRKHLRERAGREWPVAVMADVARLPLADGSVNAVAFEDAAAAGFGVSRQALAGVAAEWKRVLAPGGVVFLGVANRLHRLPGLGRLRAAFRARPHPDPLNRQVKRWAAPGGRGRLGFRRSVRTMTDLGFRRPAVYAPLPDENDAQVVIPVDDAQVVRYFLNNLIRRNSRSVRAALRAAHLLVDVGVFGRLVPYYYLIFRTDA